ncbi:MAG: hypothetical protein M3457_17250 [Chloroflexota bacterium]|nr:hypothetical protein [Chloroflexota bacterium]
MQAHRCRAPVGVYQHPGPADLTGELAIYHRHAGHIVVLKERKTDNPDTLER